MVANQVKNLPIIVGFVKTLILLSLFSFAVVYDNDLTDAFFLCLAHLCSLTSEPPAIVVSLEKRYKHTSDWGQDSCECV